MINFEEELKKFKPSLDVENAEDAIRGEDLTDVVDLLREFAETASDSEKKD